MRKLLTQILKFGVVGALAFGIDYGVMVLLVEVFHIDPLISTTVSFTISVIFNYLASMRYVFSHREGMSRRREFIIFVVLSAAGLAINEAMMWAGITFTSVDYRIVKIAATVVVMVWNFATRKALLEGDDAAGGSPRARRV